MEKITLLPELSTVTSVRLLVEDWKYVKANGLQFSELLRNAIANDRAVRDGHIVINVEREREKRERFQTINEKLMSELAKKLSIEEFDEVIRKL